MNAGAHDGSSLLEAAFDEFSGGGRDPGIAIVKSAGNERGFAGHARLTFASSTIDELRWQVKAAMIPRPSRQDVFELWFKACDEFEFRIQDPAKQWSSSVSWTKPTISEMLPSGNKISMSYTRYHHDNGDSRLLINVGPGSAKDITSGVWTLEITSGQIRSRGEINAWVERNGERLATFSNHLDEEMTLSIPGTARTVISVGAVSSSLPAKTAPFSSFGPTRDRREQPDIVAPGIDIVAAAATTKDKTLVESGTSMAAPHVSGAIALLFSYMSKHSSRVLPNALQVRAALTQHAQNFSGHFTPSNGYGIIDVEALLRAFE
jgi:endonuclease G